MPSLRDVLRSIWTEHAPADDGWRRPLYLKHIEKIIMRTVARVPPALPVAGAGPGAGRPPAPVQPSVPGIDGRVPDSTVCALREQFRTGGWDRTFELVTCGAGLAARTLAACTAADRKDLPGITRESVSEWAAGIVAAHYRDHGRSPTEEELAKAAAGFLETRAGSTARARAAVRLTDDALTQHYRSVYDDLWSEHGTAALRTLSPRSLGLGLLDRPPWTGSGNWRAGADRSVLSRYARYFDRRAWVRSPTSVAEAAGLDPGQHISARLAHLEPDALARLELRRACAPIGLRHSGHRGLVTSVVHGLADADLQSAYRARPRSSRMDHRPALTAWAADVGELSDAPDPALAEEVAAYAEQWVRHNDIAERFVRRLADPPLPARPGRRAVAPVPSELNLDEGPGLDWLVRQVRLGVPRRVWHFAHGREVQWEHPFLRAEVPTLVRGCFQKHVLELFRNPVVDPREEPPEPVPDPEVDRMEATLRALNDHDPTGALVAEALALDPGGRAHRLLEIHRDATTGGAEFTAEHALRYLAPERFLDWAAGYLGDDGTGDL